jgi:hypothetical protein
MAPVWMIEGAEHETGMAPPEENERLSELARAIREHESASRRQAMPARPQDLILYRRLRRICSAQPPERIRG